MIIGKESIEYSVKKLSHRKMRSFLTILSIFIGIAAIFVFVSFGIGLYDYVGEFVSSSSADKITIMPKGVGAPGLDDTFAITKEDVRAIQQTSGVEEATGMYAKVAEIKQDKLIRYTFIMGYDPNVPIIFEISNIGLEKGRWLKQGEQGKVVLGYNYMFKDKIFPKAYDLNDKIIIQGKELRIVGFVGAVGNPQDDSQIYTTNEEMELLYTNLKGYGMVAADVEEDNVDVIVERIERSLRNSRDLDKGKEDFFVQSWADLIETYGAVLNGIIGFVVLIALVSVLVSAVNTSNTMITSVLERTREIGVMKAVGARNKEIFKIFLFESALLGFIAGVLGVVLGAGISYIIQYTLEVAGWSFLKPSFSITLFIGLIVFATLTGAISGAIPAYKASKTNPVTALRYE